MTKPTRIPLELEIPTGRETRLLVRTHTTPTGRDVVAVLPQYVGRGGDWVLKHSGLCLPPDVARELAPALVEMAATAEATTDKVTA